MESNRSLSRSGLVLLVAIGLAVNGFAAAVWREGETRTGVNANVVKAEAALLFGAGWLPLSKALMRRKRNPTAPPGDDSNSIETKYWDLSTRVFSWSKRDHVTLAEACMGFQIWGATGAGKSTGSLATISRAFLTSPGRPGGLYLCCKPDDRETYERQIREAGRWDDLLLFGPQHPNNTYNFIADELSQNFGLGLVENLSTLLCTVAELAQRNSSKGDGREDGAFWNNMFKQLCRNAIQLLVLAKGTATVSDLYALVLSAPASRADVRSPEFRKRSLLFECLAEADNRQKTSEEQSDFELLTAFFLTEWVQLSDKSKSIVASQFSSTLDVLNRGVVKTLMSNSNITIRPSMTAEGRIIIIDMPVMVYKELGQYVQVIWKYCFQRCMSRRAGSSTCRPTFLICDESHLLATETDQVFQTTARSTRTCVVYATQSISNYLAAFGGEKAEPQVHSLLGNLQNQVFHQQTDIRTNQYAAELIGKTRKNLCQSSNSYQRDDWHLAMAGMADNTQTTAGVSETIDYEIQPSVFTSLAKGGPPQWEVEGIVYQGGKRFKASGKTYMPVNFRQAH